MPPAQRHLAGPLVAALAVATVLAAGTVPAAADHVQPRDIADACPPDREGADADRYSDVDGTTFESEIACVSDYRIALGTGDGRYSPSAPITRQQMALFLYRLALSAHLPLQAANNQFTDVDQLPQHVRDAINVIAHLGITQGGATGDRFEPAATVSRGQMASFLNRFHAVANGTEGFPAGEDAFHDDDGSVHERAINAAAAAGIAAGLGGEQDRLFAPNRPLTRGQMAGFLARLLDAEVEAGTIGPRFVEPEQIEGLVVSDVETGNRIGLDTDGDGSADRLVHYDGNDAYLFGDQPGTVEEFYDLSGERPRVLSVGDRLSVTYLPNFFDTSTVRVVDDQVGPPHPVLATAVPADSGAQDDVRIVWSNTETSTAVVTRFRSPVGADGTCSRDETAYVEDGTVDGPRSRSSVLNPGSEPPTTHPQLVDESVPGEGCYLYRIASVSERVEGSTPSPPASTNPVLVDGTVDTEPPSLLRAEVVSHDETGAEIVLTFGDERWVQTLGAVPAVVWCRPPGFKNGYPLAAGPGTAEGNEVTLRVAPESSSFDPAHCDATVYEIGVVDDKGNPNVQILNTPLE